MDLDPEPEIVGHHGLWSEDISHTTCQGTPDCQELHMALQGPQNSRMGTVTEQPQTAGEVLFSQGGF